MQDIAGELATLDLEVARVDRLDEHGEECDRSQHDADDDGYYPEVEAQATFIGHDGEPLFISGCLDCVRSEVAIDANPDRPVVIEMEH
jgi:hypothetical protein